LGFFLLREEEAKASADVPGGGGRLKRGGIGAKERRLKPSNNSFGPGKKREKAASTIETSESY